MQYTVDIKDQNVVFKIKGRITFQFHQEYKNILNDFLKHKTSYCEFDLSEVEFMDSSGLGILLLAKQKAQIFNVPIVLKHPSEQVHRLLETTKLDKIFTVQS